MSNNMDRCDFQKATVFYFLDRREGLKDLLQFKELILKGVK